MKDVVPESSELEQELQRIEADERSIEKLQGYKRQRRAKLVLLIGLAVAVIGGVGGWGVFEMVAVLAAGLSPFLASLKKRPIVGTLVGGLTMGVVAYLISGSRGIGVGEMAIIFLVMFVIWGTKRMLSRPSALEHSL